MFYVILAVLFALAAAFGPRFFPPELRTSAVGWSFRAVMSIIAVLLIISTSVIKIPADEVGVVRKIYGTHSLPEGHIIATNGETGYQAEIIPPGTFRIALLYNIFNQIEYMPIVTVPNGFYGRIVARDGKNLREGQIMADAWSDADFSKYLDAEYFMTHGGQRGEQLSVLKPGTYPMNLKLFEVRIGYVQNGKDQLHRNDDIYDQTGLHHQDTPLDTSVTKIDAGFVGVVRSSVQTPNINCKPIQASVNDNGGLSAELVPENCKGIWSTALQPGDYFLNRDAYDVTPVDTRVQTVTFAGGYVRRTIALSVDAKGDFTQKETTNPVSVPTDASSDAVNTKVEGWEIPQELRALIQISPDHAPIIVAAVGGLKQVEQRIMIPSIRSRVRNVYGGMLSITQPDGKVVIRPTEVLDTVTNRPALEHEILKAVQDDGEKAGVDVKEIRLAESVIPPELLLARQREQLAGQLRQAFQQEQLAQEQRQTTEAARATADQQQSLVAAQIDAKKAEQFEAQRRLQGAAEKEYLEQVAAGQKAQTDVLGKDSVIMFNMADKILKVLAEHPDIIANQKWPTNLFIGASPVENAAGMLSVSGLMSELTKLAKPVPTTK